LKNRLYLKSGQRLHGEAASDHERRLQRLQEIMDEVVALTDWNKLWHEVLPVPN
jgi:hypothetical protein